MSRTPNNFPVTAAPEVNEERVRADLVAADTLAVTEAYADKQSKIALEIGKRLGRRQMTTALRAFANVSELIDLQKIKESKQYKGFRLISESGELLTVSSWDEYCLHVEGRSRQAVDLDLLNFKKLGGEFFEAMHAIGIGPSSMRDIRQLPGDAQDALMIAAATKDQDAFLDLAEALISKHTAEKAALKTEAEVAVGNYKAQETISANKQARIEQLERENALIAHMPPDEYGEKLRGEVFKLAGMAEVSVLALRPALNALVEHREQHPGIDQPMLEGLLANIEAALIGLRNEYGLKDAPSADTRPEWVQLMESGQLDTAPSVEPLAN
jgi:hypothetical protein